MQAALEWQDWKQSLCAGCGLPRHETMHPDNERAYDAEPLKCHACAARERKGKAINGQENFDASGIYVAVRMEDE